MQFYLSVVDYVVFGILFLLLICPAVYNGWIKKDKNKDDYLLAGRYLSPIGFMGSVCNQYIKVSMIIGYPAELFYRGCTLWETIYSTILTYPIVCYIFIPVYYKLGITSVYQYLDLRFKSKLVRGLASLTFTVRSVLLLGVTVFTPCVALKTITDIPYWMSILAIGAISIVFTLMGGLNAVVRVDILQGLTMTACILAIVIQGFIHVGGVAEGWKIASDRGRLDFFNFDPDPTIRATTLSAIVGHLFMSLSVLGCQQNFVQRYCSMKSQAEVVKTMMLNIPLTSALFSLTWIAGVAIFAVYADCDPLLLGYTKSIDEIVPFFVQDKFSIIPGVLGLFLASLFNGALSLSLSLINSLAAVTWEDFLSQIPYFKDISDKKQLIILKIIGAMYGVLTAGVAYLVSQLSGLIESTLLMGSATSGPLLGVFILAMLFPSTNWKGAFMGMVAGHGVIIWIVIGALSIKRDTPILPLSADGCTNDTFTSLVSAVYTANTSISIDNTRYFYNVTLSGVASSGDTGSNILHQIYSVTYMYYALIGTVITVVVGVLVSCISGSSPEDSYDEKLIHPWVKKLSSWMSRGRKQTLTIASNDISISYIGRNSKTVPGLMDVE